MRYTTLTSALLLGLSGAALAQVAGAPIEQKGGNATAGNDAAAPGNDASPAGNATITPDATADRSKR